MDYPIDEVTFTREVLYLQNHNGVICMNSEKTICLIQVVFQYTELTYFYLILFIDLTVWRVICLIITHDINGPIHVHIYTRLAARMVNQVQSC